jgi:dihydroorotate dehydrogenase (NAD+) catalytic subunit
MDLALTVFGLRFQNPVLLAAGTCGFGRELEDVVDLDALGGFVTKSVTLEPRVGNAAPRVAEVPGAMINSIGLANPGLDAVRGTKIPWLRERVASARVFISIAGHRVDEYLTVLEALDQDQGFDGFELNLSCPNDARLGGRPFSLDPEALVEVIAGARRRTQRPLLAKLAPNDPDIGETAARAEEAGADGLTLVNTLPGLVIDPETGRAAVGAGSGGVSGPALRAIGVHAVWRARSRVQIPIVGVGGISTAEHALQYIMAGASLVQIGTASFADPRSAERVVQGLTAHRAVTGVENVGELVGSARISSTAEEVSPDTVHEEEVHWQR